VIENDVLDEVEELLETPPRAPVDLPDLPFADIARALDANDSANVGGYLYRADGVGLIYGAAVNLSAGEPGDGKTTLALIAARSVLEAGGTVFFLDPEDVVERVLARSLALGAKRHDLLERFHYLAYPDMIQRTKEAVAGIAASIEGRYALVILDGVADALGSHGLDEDRAADYARWHALVPRPLASAGAAVILNDHMAKARESRGLWPRGSGHKLAAVDGVAYHVTAPTPFSRTSDGVIQLTIAKAGHIGPKKATAARILISPEDNGARINYRVERPLVEVAHDGSTAVHLGLGERILEAIAIELRHDGVAGPTRNAIADRLRAMRVRFNDKHLTPTILHLEEQGRLVRTPRPGQGHHHALPVQPQENEPPDDVLL
jgi:hypothetical protein